MAICRSQPRSTVAGAAHKLETAYATIWLLCVLLRLAMLPIRLLIGIKLLFSSYLLLLIWNLIFYNKIKIQKVQLQHQHLDRQMVLFIFCLLNFSELKCFFFTILAPTPQSTIDCSMFLRNCACKFDSLCLLSLIFKRFMFISMCCTKYLSMVYQQRMH